METIVWIVVAIIVVLAVAALVAAFLRKKQAEKRTEQHRRQAEHLRHEAVSNVDRIDHTHLEAKEAEARAERARLEAERAQAEAAEAQRAVDMERATYEDRIREADRLDPDVDHRSRSYSDDPYLTDSHSSSDVQDTEPHQDDRHRSV